MADGMVKAAGAPHVLQAIALVMADLATTGISKSRRNQQQGYAFRGIDDVYNALAPLLATNGLIILPRVLARACEARETAKGGVLYSVTVEVEFSLMSARDGSSVVCVAHGEAMDSGDKATNKAMSAAYKYMAMQVFCIPTEGDHDADAHTPEPTRAVKSSPPAPPASDDSRVKVYVNGVIGSIAAAADMDELEMDVDRLHASPAWKKLQAEHPQQAKRIQDTIAAKIDALREREPA